MQKLLKLKAAFGRNVVPIHHLSPVISTGATLTDRKASIQRYTIHLLPIGFLGHPLGRGTMALGPRRKLSQPTQVCTEASQGSLEVLFTLIEFSGIFFSFLDG